MSSHSPTLQKLMDYLRSLPVATRGFLISELEKAQNTGKDIAGADFILDALRKVEAESEAAAEALGTPKGIFFTPVEPFLSETVGEKKTAGLIHSQSIDPIWTWLERDADPAAFNTYKNQVKAALVKQDVAGAKAIAAQFYAQVVKLIDAQLASARDDMSRRRIMVQLGGDRVYEDLKDVQAVLRSRDALSAIAKRLPLGIKNFADEPFETCFALFSAPSVRSNDIFPFAMVLLLSRLSQPVQIVRMAVKAVDSDSPAKIAESQFKFAVELMLERMESLAVQVKLDIQQELYGKAVPYIKDLHDIARGLRTEIDLSSDGPWSRRLANVRTDIATIIKPVLDGLPGHIRRMLRIHPAGDRHHTTIDNDEVSTIENQIDFLVACRNFAGELSMNEVTRRVLGEVQSYLESQPTTLIESLRTAQGESANILVAQIEVSVRLCTRMFGASYAQLLQKSADVVINGERKSVEKKSAEKKGAEKKVVEKKVAKGG